MTDYIHNGLLAMEKSLRDVIMPSLDKSDPLAREQLNLAIDYLRFVRQRLDFVAPRVRFEFDHYRRMAAAVLESAAESDAKMALAGQLRATESVGMDPYEPLHLLRDAAAALASAINQVVLDSTGAPSAQQGAVDRAILAATDEWIDLELSWYDPIAVESDAGSVRPLNTFFSHSTSSLE